MSLQACENSVVFYDQESIKEYLNTASYEN